MGMNNGLLAHRITVTIKLKLVYKMSAQDGNTEGPMSRNHRYRTLCIVPTLLFQTACSHTENIHKGPGKLKGLVHSAWERRGKRNPGRLPREGDTRLGFEEWTRDGQQSTKERRL